ncbi:MAG: hypothetical protein WC794_06315 [Candidatus Doudnabacteria bacterium]
MSNDFLSSFKNGLMSAFGPGVAKGALVKFLKDTDFKSITEMIKNNDRIWDYIPELQQNKVIEMAQASDFSWLTVDWLLEAVQKEMPYLVSYFLSSKKAMDWLVFQLDDIKREVGLE